MASNSCSKGLSKPVNHITSPNHTENSPKTAGAIKRATNSVVSAIASAPPMPCANAVHSSAPPSPPSAYSSAPRCTPAATIRCHRGALPVAPASRPNPTTLTLHRFPSLDLSIAPARLHRASRAALLQHFLEMDKKNTVIGVALIAAAIAFMFWMQQSAPPPPPRPAPAASAPAGTATSDASTAAANTAPTSAPASAVNTAFAAARADSATAKVTTLSNSFIEVHFTDSGGAIRDVALKKRDAKDRLIYPAELNGSTPFIFNELHADPMLAFVDFPGLDRSSRFERVSQSSSEVVYRAVLDGRLEVTRRYTLPPDESDKTDPYQLRHEQLHMFLLLTVLLSRNTTNQVEH